MDFLSFFFMHAKTLTEISYVCCRYMTWLIDIISFQSIVSYIVSLGRVYQTSYYFRKNAKTASSTTHTTSYTVNDLATESSAEPTTNVEPITSSETTTGSTNEPEHYTYFTRSEWSLITNDFTNLTTPIKRVIIAHTVTYPCVVNIAYLYKIQKLNLIYFRQTAR